MTRSEWFARRLVQAAAALTILCAAGLDVGRAADEEATARALFVEGRRLTAAGDYLAACPKFEDSYRLDPGIGTNFNLADCFEHIGRTASAWARFMDVAAATRAAGQTEREKVARARAQALEPRLARLTVVVRRFVDGLVVTRDGTPLGAASWGVPVPVDPGRHVIEATAPGKQSWSSTAEVPDRAEAVSIEVPALADAPMQLLVAAARPSDHQIEPRRSRAMTGAALATAGVGLAGLVAGTVFALEFESTNRQAKGICVDNADDCPPQQVDYHDHTLVPRASRELEETYIAYGIAGAAIAAAAYLWWRSVPHPRLPTPAVVSKAGSLDLVLHF